MRGIVVLALLPALYGEAQADRLLDPPHIQPPPSMRERIIDAMTVLAEHMEHHLDTLSFDQIKLSLDPRSRTGRLRIGGDVLGESLHFKLRSGIRFQHGYARFNAKIDLGLGLHRLSFKIPTFDVVPRSHGGRTYVELRVPLIRGRF
jgi:hypothetical protein